MARPVTKEGLLESANTQFDKLWQLIDSMSEEEQTADFDFGGTDKKEAHWKRDKNLRDVLIHLYEWHQLLLGWVDSNRKGETKPFLPPPYTWKTYGQMNIEFWEKHQNTSLEKAKASLKISHLSVMQMLDSFSNEELFTKQHFSWTGTTNLGSYCISATSSHYDWAAKKLKAYLKVYRSDR